MFVIKTLDDYKKGSLYEIKVIYKTEIKVLYKI